MCTITRRYHEALTEEGIIAPNHQVENLQATINNSLNICSVEWVGFIRCYQQEAIPRKRRADERDGSVVENECRKKQQRRSL